MTKFFDNFADLASFIATETGDHDRSSTYERAFLEHDERAKLSPVEDTSPLETPAAREVR